MTMSEFTEVQISEATLRRAESWELHAAVRAGSLTQERLDAELVRREQTKGAGIRVAWDPITHRMVQVEGRAMSPTPAPSPNPGTPIVVPQRPLVLPTSMPVRIPTHTPVVPPPTGPKR